LWRAFEAAEAQQVKEAASGQRAGETLADLVQLVRHAIEPTGTRLVPYAPQGRVKFAMWMREKERAGVTFTADQREWLRRMAEHIATSLTIEPEDFQTGWFGQHGSLGRAHALFGETLKALIAELNERLAA
jgi:type I restriction enzyme R subunit